MTRLLIIVLTALAMTGCGTGAYNELVRESHQAQVAAWSTVRTQQAASMGTAMDQCGNNGASAAEAALCRSNAMLASVVMSLTAGQMPAAPQYRSAAQDFNLVATPIIGGVNSAMTVASGAYGLRQNRLLIESLVNSTALNRPSPVIVPPGDNITNTTSIDNSQTIGEGAAVGDGAIGSGNTLVGRDQGGGDLNSGSQTDQSGALIWTDSPITVTPPPMAPPPEEPPPPLLILPGPIGQQ